MSFRDFTFPQVIDDLGLTIQEVDLYSRVAPLPLRPYFAERIEEGLELAVSIGTEKARSEFLTAPILAELRSICGRQIGIFSGIEFDVDTDRGLNGDCDFIVSRSSIQTFVTAPIIAVAGAKPDIPSTGFGQCISVMTAARLFNESRKQPATILHGASTSGTTWQFLRLEGQVLTIDWQLHYISNVGKLLGILKTMVTSA